jgi:hypothetical protein
MENVDIFITLFWLALFKDNMFPCKKSEVHSLIKEEILDKQRVKFHAKFGEGYHIWPPYANALV